MTQDHPSISDEEMNSVQAALGKCSYAQLSDIRTALDSRADALKSEFMAQAEAMGLACHDNGKPSRKRRTSKDAG